MKRGWSRPENRRIAEWCVCGVEESKPFVLAMVHLRLSIVQQLIHSPSKTAILHFQIFRIIVPFLVSLGAIAVVVGR